MYRILKSSIPYQGPSTENVIELVRDGLRKHADLNLIIESSNGVKWTGREMESVILKVSKFLIEDCGIKKGDVCSIYLRESDIAAILILSVISVGAICKYITHSSVRALTDTARVSGSKFIISSEVFMSDIFQELNADDVKRTYIAIDGCHDNYKNIANLLDRNSKIEGINFDELISRSKIDPERDIAVIQFSSGTTGKPKRIPRTHKNLCHLVASVDHPELMDLRPGEVITGNLGLSFRPGLWALLACVNAGSTLLIIDTKHIGESFPLVDKYKVTILALNIISMNKLASVDIPKKKDYDLSSLRHVMTSGAKIVDPAIPKKFVEELNLKTFRQCFGMTESGWVFLIEQSKAADMFLTVGHVVPGTEAIVIDRSSGEKLEANQRGEIALRGPQIFPGYMTDKSGVFNRDDFTHDGWFKIGDEGYYDENEYIYIVGRYKEQMYLRSCRRYYPDEIEAILADHPAIESVCVVKVGMDDKGVHDVARAYVSLKPGATLREQDLLDYLLKDHPLIILDAGIRILDSFPRMANGKINKQALKLMD